MEAPYSPSAPRAPPAAAARRRRRAAATASPAAAPAARRAPAAPAAAAPRTGPRRGGVRVAVPERIVESKEDRPVVEPVVREAAQGVAGQISDLAGCRIEARDRSRPVQPVADRVNVVAGADAQVRAEVVLLQH